MQVAELVMRRLAQFMAILGGIVLLAIIVFVCISVFGREIADLAHRGALGGFGAWLLEAGIGPILGDYEVVGAAIAFTIFACLPLTQLSGAHAQVDIFTAGLGVRFNHGLAVFWSIVMAVIIILITWRLSAGLADKYRYGETTYLIQFPIWWAYAASLFAAITASITSVYCVIREAIGGAKP